MGPRSPVMERPSEARTSSARAHKLEAEIVKGCAAMRGVWLHLAQALYRFHQEEAWTPLGFSSFAEFLSQPSIDLTREHGHRLVRLYAEFVVERGIPYESLRDTSMDKLDRVLGAVRTGRVSVDKALTDARTLTHRELRTKYRQPDAHPTRQGWVCPTCGARRREAPE